MFTLVCCLSRPACSKGYNLFRVLSSQSSAQIKTNSTKNDASMKIKVINRSEEDFTQERTQDLRKVHRNLDPKLHPFEKAVEYTRALNAAKLTRVFAKPFIAAFSHDDGVTCLARNPARLNSLLSGCANGDIRLWDVPAQR